MKNGVPGILDAEVEGGKTPCFVTARAGTVYTDSRQIHHDWNVGEKFRLYQAEREVTRADAFGLKVSGFTHVWFVWQDPEQGNRVVASEISL